MITRAEISAAVGAQEVLAALAGVVTAGKLIVHTVNAGVVAAALKEVYSLTDVLAAPLTVLGVICAAGGVISNASEDTAIFTGAMIAALTYVVSAIKKCVISVLTGEVATAVHAVLTVHADIMTAILQGVIALVNRSVAGVTVDYLGAAAE